jgi:formate-dependent nitrite reductase membrane component NrfD
MIDAPSSTWFTASPHWQWLIALYFFFGGLAGGCYFLAALIDLFGRREDRPVARLGYFIALPCLVVSAVVLIFDLARPLRFWHLMLESNTFQPMVKPWSPMSFGTWMIMAFGLFAFFSFLSALAESGRPMFDRARRVRPPGALGAVLTSIGGLLGLYVAGYTGVLLAVTNRPIWSDTPLLGMLLVVSATSISLALLLLLARGSPYSRSSVLALHRMDAWVIVLEFLALIAVIASLGAVARAWLNGWGLLLFVAVLLGMAAPLLLYRRRDAFGRHTVAVAAVLVLVGGFILRLAIVFSPGAVT